MRKGFFISALVALVLVASATGAERPPFARAYVGTVMGTLRMNGRVDSWKVEGLTFRLQSPRFARGRWGEGSRDADAPFVIKGNDHGGIVPQNGLDVNRRA